MKEIEIKVRMELYAMCRYDLRKVISLCIIDKANNIISVVRDRYNQGIYSILVELMKLHTLADNLETYKEKDTDGETDVLTISAKVSREHDVYPTKLEVFHGWVN
jgi:hypothetical protein